MSGSIQSSVRIRRSPFNQRPRFQRREVRKRNPRSAETEVKDCGVDPWLSGNGKLRKTPWEYSKRSSSLVNCAASSQRFHHASSSSGERFCRSRSSSLKNSSLARKTGTNGESGFIGQNSFCSGNEISIGDRQGQVAILAIYAGPDRGPAGRSPFVALQADFVCPHEPSPFPVQSRFKRLSSARGRPQGFPGLLSFCPCDRILFLHFEQIPGAP